MIRQRYCAAIEYDGHSMIVRCDDGKWRVRAWRSDSLFSPGFATRHECRHWHESGNGPRNGKICYGVDIEPAPRYAGKVQP
jgi:hypothetical protein